MLTKSLDHGIGHRVAVEHNGQGGKPSQITTCVSAVIQLQTERFCRQIDAIRLNGEMLRNDVMTEAANACQEADMLMVLGTNLKDPAVGEILKYFQTEKLVLISKNEHYSDKMATVCINDEVRNVLPRIVC